VHKDDFANAGIVAVELKARHVRYQTLKQRFAFDERKLRDVPIRQVQKIEGVKNKMAGLLPVPRTPR
jgi:hypothetical protein